MRQPRRIIAGRSHPRRLDTPAPEEWEDVAPGAVSIGDVSQLHVEKVAGKQISRPIGFQPPHVSARKVE